MLREYIYLTDDEIQLTPICEDCGPNAVPIMRKEELIRCKDCKHWDGDDYETFCSELGIFGTDPNSFCSYGQRRKEERRDNDYAR